MGLTNWLHNKHMSDPVEGQLQLTACSAGVAGALYQVFLSPVFDWSDVAPRRLDLHAFVGEVHGVPRRANLALPVHLARP
jgi:hypothetical protein